MSIDKAKIKDLAEAATKGDWRYGPGDGDDENPIVFIDLPQASGVAISVLFEADWATDADAAFVAKASPQTVLALLAENEALRKDAERYRWIRDGAGYCDTRDIPGMAPARMDEFIDAAMAKERGQ